MLLAGRGEVIENGLVQLVAGGRDPGLHVRLVGVVQRQLSLKQMPGGGRGAVFVLVVGGLGDAAGRGGHRSFLLRQMGGVAAHAAVPGLRSAWS